MMKRIIAACLFVGTLVATASAQAPLTPQQSLQQSPNMPPPREIVPERIRPADPETTGTIRRSPTPNDTPKIDSGGKQAS